MIYAIAPDRDGPSKIGVTTDIMSRVRSLQTGCWLPLKVYDFRLSLPKNMGSMKFNLQHLAHQGATMAEKDAHSALRSCELGLTGEWFDVTPEEAMQVIDKCALAGDYRSFSLAQVAGAATSLRLDPEVHKAKNRLAGAMLKIKSMAASASQEGVDMHDVM